MERTELGAWLRLTEAAGVGPVTARRLLTAFGSPESVCDASMGALSAVVGERLARAVAQPDDALEPLLEATWAWLQTDPDRAIVALGDPSYPTPLLEAEDPPLMLYVQGRISALQHGPSVAVVGSRNPTPQGESNARAFSRALSEAGVCVVSGLALGIDGAAHAGALEGGSPTLAVVGTGLDRVYPKRHLALARQIASQGALISEYPIGTPPLAAHFPKRNRIIAGLSQGTLVVEAGRPSGSLITAEQALQMGREVFAIPGSIHAPQSKGCHALIRQGAKLVESAQDILEDLRITSVAPLPAAYGNRAGDGCALLKALGHDPCHLDSLQARTGWDTATLQVKLLELELEGTVARMAGGLYQRCATV